MPFSLRPFLLVAGFAAAPFAHADTVTSFDLSATLQQGSANGTVDLDTTTGLYTAANFTVLSDGSTYSFVSAPAYSGSFPNPMPTLYYADFADAAGDEFQLSLPFVSLAGYAGSAICSTTDALCQSQAISLFVPAANTTMGDSVVTGSLSQTTSVTPEPSSFVLLGTGLLSMGQWLRRRRA